ncbi:MAG TPA: hypothetical protein VL475_01020, partial [Planctomycetaceae bacterium]|nr:hypothetical protein [Planctomycetaceae bacterium]
MASWRRWIVVSALCCAVTCGCGGSDTKKPEGAVEGGPPVVAAPAAAAPNRTPPAVAAPSLSGMQELLQYAPENLKLAAGASVAVLGEKTHPVGARLLTQFQPVIATLARAGVNVDQIDKLWGGVNRETGDLIVCVRTRGNYDVAAATTGLGASGTAERVGKATVYNLPAHPVYKNAVAFIDPKTFLMGRYATVTAALTNPKPGPVRLGYDALNQPDAYYWIAGDDSCLEPWLKSGGIDPLELLAAEAVNLRGIGVGFGGKGVSPSPMGAASASATIDLSLGMGFASEALATSIEKKFSQMLQLRQKGALPGSDTSGIPSRPGGGENAYRFQQGRRDSDEDDRRNPLGR